MKKCSSNIILVQIAELAAGPMLAQNSILAIAGRGLEGDRYFNQKGTFSKNAKGGREVTFIEVEALEAFERDYGIKLDPRESRRNIVTRGVALNHLVGLEFQAGSARLKGVRLCEPCAHLEKLTGAKVLPGLVHRGGLRAAIVMDGVIQVGDSIVR